MYRLTTMIPNDIALNLIPEVAFNPSGTLFAVSHQQSSELVVFDAHTRTVLRVYKNPEAGLDIPHGVLLTEKHIVVSNTYGFTRPSTFAIYSLSDPSDKPVSVYETPYPHLREAHSLALRNGILVATYCESAKGPGAVVSYRFDDEAGLIGGPIALREACFTPYGEPKGVAFSGDGAEVFVTYTTQKRMTGVLNYVRRVKAARIVWQGRGVVACVRYIYAKTMARFHAMRAPDPQLKNGIAVFGITPSGMLSEMPVRVLERDNFCRLENIAIVGNTVVISDTINGTVYLHDLATDPRLELPVHAVTESLVLPHGAKLSPDRTTLVVTNYGLKVENQIIHWKTPARSTKNSVLIYDWQPA
jgi:DNA-binding beta-propeller fold protein YncE